MSRIILVQPSKMLQQAFAFALASEHQLQVTDHIPESEVAPDADLAIVDAAALRGGDAAAGRELAAIRSWRMPVVWVGAEAPRADSAPRRFVQLAPPLDRESLKKALADCLGVSSDGTSLPTAPRPPGAAVSKPTKPKELKRGAAAKENKEVIELVEVVEEQPARDVAHAGARKKS